MTCSLKGSQEVASKESKAVTSPQSDILGGLNRSCGEALVWLPSSFLLFCSSCRAVARKWHLSTFSEISLPALELKCPES